METKKEERTEHIFIYVTPKVKKEFEMAQDNKKLQDEIIRNHISIEKDWLKSEMQEIDESVIIYRSKLINIKERFQKAQSIYIKEIESIAEKADNTFRKFDKIADKLERKIATSYNKIDILNNKISNINSNRLDELMDAIDRFSNMTNDQKKLIELIIKQK